MLFVKQLFHISSFPRKRESILTTPQKVNVDSRFRGNDRVGEFICRAHRFGACYQSWYWCFCYLGCALAV